MSGDRFPPRAPAPIARQQVELPPLARQPTIPAELLELARCNERVAHLEAGIRAALAELETLEATLRRTLGA